MHLTHLLIDILTIQTFSGDSRLFQKIEIFISICICILYFVKHFPNSFSFLRSVFRSLENTIEYQCRLCFRVVISVWHCKLDLFTFNYTSKPFHPFCTSMFEQWDINKLRWNSYIFICESIALGNAISAIYQWKIIRVQYVDYIYITIYHSITVNSIDWNLKP